MFDMIVYRTHCDCQADRSAAMNAKEEKDVQTRKSERTGTRRESTGGTSGTVKCDGGTQMDGAGAVAVDAHRRNVQSACATHARTARAVRGRGDCSVVVVGTSEVDAARLHSELGRMLA